MSEWTAYTANKGGGSTASSHRDAAHRRKGTARLPAAVETPPHLTWSEWQPLENPGPPHLVRVVQLSQQLPHEGAPHPAADEQLPRRQGVGVLLGWEKCSRRQRVPSRFRCAGVRCNNTPAGRAAPTEGAKAWQSSMRPP